MTATFVLVVLMSLASAVSTAAAAALCERGSPFQVNSTALTIRWGASDRSLAYELEARLAPADGHDWSGLRSLTAGNLCRQLLGPARLNGARRC